MSAFLHLTIEGVRYHVMAGFDPEKTRDVWCLLKPGDARQYTVKAEAIDGRRVLSCTCPDFLYRRSAKGETCKHIAAALETGLL